MLPQTGGVYVYLRAAYGDGTAFTFGWLYLLVTTPATLGALATFFAELLVGAVMPGSAGMPAWAVPLTAAATIAVLSTANALGTVFGTAIQGVSTALKVTALLALMVASLAFSPGSLGNLAPSAGGPANLGSGAASVIWAYDGWVAVSMIAGEVKAPERLLRRIIPAGMMTIVLLYVGANVGYFYAMPVTAMAVETAGVPQRIVGDLLGTSGALAVTGAIMVSVFGALNGNVLAKPRVVYALGRDGLTFPWLGRAHPRWATPHRAILIQGGVAVLLIAVLRDFDRLTTYFVVVEWSALLFAVGAVLVLRRRRPEAPRPYRTPLYPWVPLAFLSGTAVGLGAIVWGQVARDTPDYSSLVGLLIAVSGFPVYWLWRRLKGAGSRGGTVEAAE
jgi:APA family basic amino acid/polyamine antiporter